MLKLPVAKNPETSPTAKSLFSRLAGLWTLPIYFLLTLGLTWPLALNWSAGVVRGTPDHYLNLWTLWQVRTRLWGSWHNPYFSDSLFYPFRDAGNPVALYYHPLLPAESLPGALLSFWLGLPATFNLLVIAAFTLSGWAAYLLAYYFLQPVAAQLSAAQPVAGPSTTIPHAAAFVTGLTYTFCAYHFHNLEQGQLPVLWWVWIPLYLLFLHGTFDSKKWTTTLAALAFLWLSTLTDWYATLYLLLYTLGFGLYRLWLERRHFRPLFSRLAGLGIGWLLLSAPLLYATLQSGRDATILLVEGRGVEILQSASLVSLLSADRNGWHWTPHFLGYTALLLAGLGLWWGWRKGALGWFITFLVCTVMSLGPYWRSGDSETGFPLPYWLLSQLPLVNVGRSPIRFQMLGRLGLAMLAGWATLALWQYVTARWRWEPRLASWVVPMLVSLPFLLEVQALPAPVETLPQPEFFRQIATEPGNFALFEMPMTKHYAEDNRRMYFQTLHGKAISSGYISRKTIDYYRADGSLFETYFDVKGAGQDAFAKYQPGVTLDGLTKNQSPQDFLAAYNFRYVVNYKDEYPTQDRAAFERVETFLEKLLGRTARIYEDKWLTAWRVNDPAQPKLPTGVLAAQSGFYPAERRPEGQSFRWAGDSASLTIHSVAANPVITFSAWSFEPENKLEVSAEGRVLATFQLYGGPQEFRLPLDFPAGRDIKLTFRTTQPSRIADPNGADKRKLAFALAEITFS